MMTVGRSGTAVAFAFAAIICACSSGVEPSASEHEGKTTEALSASGGLWDAPDSEYGQVPGGRRIHRSCFHTVPKGGTVDAATSTIKDANGNVVDKYERCKYRAHSTSDSDSLGDPYAPLPDAAKYQEYSGANARTDAVCGNWGPPYYTVRYCRAWYNSFFGTVHVPADPTNLSQAIYLWSGLSATTNLPSWPQYYPLMQPVLEWGRIDGFGGGGPYWRFASWYIDAYGNTFRGFEEPIYAGDDLKMNIYVDNNSCPLSGNGCTWAISAWSNSTGRWETMYATSVPGTFNSVYRAVLEARDSAGSIAPACNIYPLGNGTYFSGTQAWQPLTSPRDFRPVDQVWQAVTHSITPYCLYGQDIGTQDATYLYFAKL